MKNSIVMATLAIILSVSAPLPSVTAEAVARESITVMVSPLMVGFTKAINDNLGMRYGLPPLTITPALAGPAVKAFCSGIGEKTPDVIGLPRQLSKREYNHCIENGVIDIIELAVGMDALILVVRKDEPVFNLTPRAMYFALAAEIPQADDFIPNTVQRWKQIDNRLPDREIYIVGSENGTSINAFFKEIFMEGGCRGLRQFKSYYSAEDRVKTCTTLRDDGRFIGIKPPIALNFKDVFLKSPPGAIAVIPYTVYSHNTDWLSAMPVLNVMPTPAVIKSDQYEAVSPVRFYVKRRHMEHRLGGDGIVRGLYDFIEEAMSENAIGPGGYLETLGMVIDNDADRGEDRDQAMRLQPYRR
ncbi:MAG: substrate-binding domain-containing protein [Rhodospirillaceae bacterium]